MPAKKEGEKKPDSWTHGFLTGKQGAVVSNCGKYRYALWRRARDDNDRVLTFIGLNPSTADAFVDDPTIRRCIGFARDLGFGRLLMLNLFAYCATKPAEMRKAFDPIGPLNSDVLRTAARVSGMIVAAWGVHGTFMEREKQVRSILHGKLHVLQWTKAGHPSHPLYLRKDLLPRQWA